MSGHINSWSEIAAAAGRGFTGSAGCWDAALGGLDVGLRTADVDSGKVSHVKMSIKPRPVITPF